MPVPQQAAKDLYTINADEDLRQQARARADAEFWEKRQKARIQQLENTIAEKETQIEALKAQLEAQKNKFTTSLVSFEPYL